MNASSERQRRFVAVFAFFCLFLPFSAFGARIWHVDAAVAASGNGLTWPTAKKAIQEAVDAASGGDQIWVAEGIYYEHVMLKSDLCLYGGFSRNETTVDERDLSIHQTFLDWTGQTGDDHITTDHAGDFLIDGFDIQGGGLA